MNENDFLSTDVSPFCDVVLKQEIQSESEDDLQYDLYLNEQDEAFLDQNEDDVIWKVCGTGLVSKRNGENFVVRNCFKELESDDSEPKVKRSRKVSESMSPTRNEEVQENPIFNQESMVSKTSSSPKGKLNKIREMVVALAKNDMDNKGILHVIENSFGQGCMALRTVQKIVREWKTNGEDAAVKDKRGGRTNAKRARTTEAICMVRDIIAVDPEVTVEELAILVGYSHGTICRILHDDLGLPKSKER